MKSIICVISILRIIYTQRSLRPISSKKSHRQSMIPKVRFNIIKDLFIIIYLLQYNIQYKSSLKKF